MENIKIKKADSHDMDEIIFYMNKFRLDDENVSRKQFQVAKARNELIGFGRIKSYGNLSELSSVGVVDGFRMRGVGRKLILSLLKKSPTDEIWLTTRIPEYFKKFGFVAHHTPPKEIELKQRNLCLKFSGDIEKMRCMLLKKQELTN